MGPNAPAYCARCGLPVGECDGCTGLLEPPRFCEACGRRMAVAVTPTSWTARCAEHGSLRAAPRGGGPSSG